MPTFFARRYMRMPAEVGRTEQVLGVLILLLAVGIVGAFVLQVSTDREYLFNLEEQDYGRSAQQTDVPEIEAARAAASEPDSPFPDPGLEGWRVPRRVDRFTADNLYVKIDGRAEAYLRFGVVGLTFGTYDHESDATRTVDVYWYNMGKPANALSMYRSEKPPGAAPLSTGAAGYQVGGAVFFCKGSSYVQVMPSRLDDADARAALTIAESVAKRIAPE